MLTISDVARTTHIVVAFQFRDQAFLNSRLQELDEERRSVMIAQ